MSLVKIIRVKDLSKLWSVIGENLLEEKNSIRGAGEYFLYLYNTVFEVEQAIAPNLFLEDVGYTPKKISHLLKSYIDPGEIKNSLREMKNSSHKWKSKKVFTDYNIHIKKKSSLEKGPCISAVSYKNFYDSLAILTIHSRSVEFPRKIIADILLVSALVNLIKETLEVEKNINVIWYMSTIWLKSRIGARIYKIYKLPEEIEFINKDFQKNVQKGWDSFIVNQKYVTYNELKRVQRLYVAKYNNQINRVTGQEKFLKEFKKYLGGE